MNLMNGIIRPGKVLEVVDNYGVVKCSAPGLFTEKDGAATLPPIYPLLQSSSNTFTKPKAGDLVWILNFTDNKMELFYIRQNNYTEQLEELLTTDGGGKYCEVLCSVESGLSHAQLFFSDGSGWILKNDETIIQINPDGNILLEYPQAHRTIEISSNGISIGTKGGSAEPAVLGNKLEDVLNKIVILLKSLGDAAALNPYTAPLSTAIKSQIPGIENAIPEIASMNITID